MPATADIASLADLLTCLPPTVSATQLARALGVSRGAIDDWARDGRLPRPTPGPWIRPRWRTAEVAAWLRRMEAEQAAK